MRSVRLMMQLIQRRLRIQVDPHLTVTVDKAAAIVLLAMTMSHLKQTRQHTQVHMHRRPTVSSPRKPVLRESAHRGLHGML